MYKITYDLVAIPAADYLIPNTRHWYNHQLAYRQMATLKDYYKYTFFPSIIVHWNALPFYISFSYCGTIRSCCVQSSTCLTVDIRSAFNLLSILTPPLHLYTFSYLFTSFIQLIPFCICIPNPVWCPPRRLRRRGRKKLRRPKTLIHYYIFIDNCFWKWQSGHGEWLHQ